MANVKKVVLVVDDSTSIRREVKVILEKDGFVVREAGSEYGLFSTIEEYSVKADVILMDISINETNGFDLVTKLQNTEKYRNIPVVMLTENSSRENVVMAKMLGVDGYIVKPINAELLREKIHNIFMNR